MRKLFVFSLVFNMVFILMLGALSWKTGLLDSLLNKVNPQTPEYSDNIFYKERTSLFNELEIPEGSIVFLGDSITHRSEWNELFQREDIINRGIGSDTTEGVLNRLEDILDSKPEKLFLLIGVNDLAYNKEIEEIKINYEKILKKIQTGSPNTKIFVQSVLPVNNEKYGRIIDNKDVQHLNREIQKIAERFNVQYIDVYAELSVNDDLPEELTVDGIHLTGKGYVSWSKLIKKYVES